MTMQIQGSFRPLLNLLVGQVLGTTQTPNRRNWSRKNARCCCDTVAVGDAEDRAIEAVTWSVFRGKEIGPMLRDWLRWMSLKTSFLSTTRNILGSQSLPMIWCSRLKSFTMPSKFGSGTSPMKTGAVSGSILIPEIVRWVDGKRIDEPLAERKHIRSHVVQSQRLWDTLSRHNGTIFKSTVFSKVAPYLVSHQRLNRINASYRYLTLPSASPENLFSFLPPQPPVKFPKTFFFRFKIKDMNVCGRKRDLIPNRGGRRRNFRPNDFFKTILDSCIREENIRLVRKRRVRERGLMGLKTRGAVTENINTQLLP